MASVLFIAVWISWLLVLALERSRIGHTNAAVSCPADCGIGYQEELKNANDGIIIAHNLSLSQDSDESFSYGRAFRGHGCAAHLFVEFGAYRSGMETFTILGLASKPLHTYGHPSFSCKWIPLASAAATSPDHNRTFVLEGAVTKDYPDYGYGRAYTVVVITCTFDEGVGTDSKGGELILHAYHGDAMGREERIVALSEKPGAFSLTAFDPPYRYDFLYCGSPLFGRLNGRRVREWITYHDMLFGSRSHFVLYDAGGIQKAVRQALQPWIRMGRISIQDIRSTAHFDGYYYNQFLMVNDCLHRSKFLANWTFFFDLDEYIYVQPPHSLHSLLAERHNHGAPDDASSVIEVSFTQYRMVKHLCHSSAGAVERARNRIQHITKQWAFEKLTYRDLSNSNRDVKYVCNPRAVYATGVHGVERIKRGWQERFNETIVRYYHYHGTIDMDDDSALCVELSDDLDSAHNFTRAKSPSGEEGEVLQYDGSMMRLAPMAKRHETEVLQKRPH